MIFPSRWKADLVVPIWINILEWFVNVVLMLTILLFVIRYRRLQLQTLANQDLEGAIQRSSRSWIHSRKSFTWP